MLFCKGEQGFDNNEVNTLKNDRTLINSLAQVKYLANLSLDGFTSIVLRYENYYAMECKEEMYGPN